MEELRKQIDQIDEKIIKLLADRTAVVQNVAEYKAKNGILVFQPDRERLLLEKIKKMAEKEGVEADFVAGLYALILEQSKKQQELYKNMA